MTTLGTHGFLIRTTEGKHYFYTPQAYNSMHVKEEGLLRELPHSLELNILYSPVSKCLVEKYNITEYRKSISISEIEQVPASKINEIFNEKEFLEQLKKDMEFSTYKPRLVTDAMNCVRNIPNNPRISEAYSVKEDRYDDVEIVAGIRCKEHADKLGEIISSDYI